MLTAAGLLLALACLCWPGKATRRDAGRAEPGTPLGAPWSGVTALVSGPHRRVPGLIDRGSPWVADFAEVVAVGLDAGLDLGAAALASARSPGVADRAPWLHDRLQASLEAGRGVSGCLEPPPGSPAPDTRDLAHLAAAWRLAEEVGAGAADVTAAAAEAVRGRRAAAERAGVVAAGPRTSMWLLTALPLAGPLAGALVGVGPDRLYGSPPGRAVAAAGLLLTGAGWWWSRAILRRAARPARTSEDRP